MIDPQAIVHRSARLADDVQVGPFTTIGANVEISSGCRIGARMVIEGLNPAGARQSMFTPSQRWGWNHRTRNFEASRAAWEIGDEQHHPRVLHHQPRNRGRWHGVTRIGDPQLWGHGLLSYCARLQGWNHTLQATEFPGWAREIGDHAVLGGFTLIHRVLPNRRPADSAPQAARFARTYPFDRCRRPCRTRGLNSEGLRRRDSLGSSPGAQSLLIESCIAQGCALTEALERLATLGIDNRIGPHSFIDNSLRGIFHFAVYAASRSDVLVPLIGSLWLQFGAYLPPRDRSGRIVDGDRRPTTVTSWRSQSARATTGPARPSPATSRGPWTVLLDEVIGETAPKVWLRDERAPVPAAAHMRRIRSAAQRGTSRGPWIGRGQRDLVVNWRDRGRRARTRRRRRLPAGRGTSRSTSGSGRSHRRPRRRGTGSARCRPR